jgi:ABC-2 type transport system permease protein
MNRPRSRLLAVIRKEVIQVLRDRRTLAVILLQPVMMLFLYGYGVSSDINNVSMGVVDWSHTQESRELLRRLTASGYFTETYTTSRYDELRRAIDGREVTIGLVIPVDFARRLDRGDQTPIQILVDGTDSTTALAASGYLQVIAGQFSAERLLAMTQRQGFGARPQGVPPIDLRLRVWYNEDLKSVVFIVPGLIVIILMSTSALLTSGAIARERERGTLEQLVASPIRPYELMAGKIVTYTVLSYIDVALVVLVGTLWFGVPLRGSIVLLTVCSGLFLMSSLGVGLLISAVTPSQRTAMLLVSMITSLPSIMLSGFYFPISSMPETVQAITYLIPARYFMVIVRGIFLKGAGWDALWQQIALLAIFGVLPLVGSVFAFKKRL